MAEFVRRNRVTIVSGALLLLSLLLVSSGARYPDRQNPVTRVLLEGVRPLQTVLTHSVESASAAWRRYVSLIGVAEENAQLRRRVLDLEQEGVRFTELQQANDRLRELLGLRQRLTGDARAAQIIARDPSPWFGTVVINKGDADGVVKHMAVLSPYGVVGQTIATSTHSARVLLVTDHNSGVDAVVQRSRARGIVQGALDGTCVMKYLKRGEDVEVGDRVITSGLDGIFPKGILLGTVTHVTRGNRGLLQLAEIKPSVPFEQIEEVLVVPPGVGQTDEVP